MPGIDIIGWFTMNNSSNIIFILINVSTSAIKTDQQKLSWKLLVFNCHNPSPKSKVKSQKDLESVYSEEITEEIQFQNSILDCDKVESNSSFLF